MASVKEVLVEKSKFRAYVKEVLVENQSSGHQ
jgi:hypothetical protein